MNEKRQANMLAREWLTNIAMGVAISIWYDWHDDGPNPHDPSAHSGLVRFPYRVGEEPVYEPKPAYLAARALTHVLDGYTFRRRLQTGGPDDYALVFTQGNRARLAAWSTNSAPHQITIAKATGRFQVAGLEGQLEGRLRAHRDYLTLTLTSTPQYVIPENRAKLGTGDYVADSKRPELEAAK
jgi:polysaccharide biosynthesis protein PslG